MKNRHGTFIWYELLTTNPGAAADFYGSVVGWRCRDSGQPDADYRQFGVGDTDVAGMMRAPDGARELPDGAASMGMRPTWLGYIGVDDVDASVERITAAGGALHMPARDIPGVGRFAMVADPQGVVFYVMRGSVDSDSTSFSPAAVGQCGWNELATTDTAAALRFYMDQFGWSKGEAMSMGPSGDYQLMQLGDVGIGAISPRQNPAAPPAWTFYFRVADIAGAARRVKSAGGQVLHGPADVPGDDQIIVGADPQGVGFALVGRKA